MQLSFNKSRVLSSLLFLGFFGILLSCSSDPEPQVNVNISVDQNAPDASDGFNLEQFHRLLLEEKPASGEWDAQFLSELVNREDINNLDLDQDGMVDNIYIEPFGGGDNVGFQLYAKIKNEAGLEEEQTICTVGVEKESDGTGSLAVSGNEQIYGSNHHYHSGGMGFGSYMMLAWMMSPRYSMMGGYGGYGGGRRVVSTTNYNKNISNRNSNHTGSKAPGATRSSTASSATSAAKQKSASNVKAGLKKPSSTQRKFQASQKAKKSTSGFAKKKSGTTKSTSSGRSSSTRSRGGK